MPRYVACGASPSFVTVNIDSLLYEVKRYWYHLPVIERQLKHSDMIKWHLYIMLESKQAAWLSTENSALKDGTAQAFDTWSRITALFNKITSVIGDDNSDG